MKTSAHVNDPEDARAETPPDIYSGPDDIGEYGTLAEYLEACRTLSPDAADRVRKAMTRPFDI